MYKAEPPGIKQQSDQVTYKITTDDQDRFLGGNPVYISSKSIYEIKLLELRAGFMRKHGFRQDNPRFTPPGADDSSWTLNQEEFLKGRELWLLTKATKLQKDDPLFVNRSFTMSSVKMDMSPFAGVPFSNNESVLFKTDDTSDYKIEVILYEVDGASYKETLAKMYKNGGISGLLTWGKQTAQGLWNGIVWAGSYDTSEEMHFVERLLLETGASKEFTGTFHLLRKDADSKPLKGDYLLYDIVKSKTFDATNSACFSAVTKVLNTNEDGSDPIYGNVYAGANAACREIVLPKHGTTNVEKQSFMRFSVNSVAHTVPAP
ncbi:MAG: hypothetical protein HQL87_16400 [Magnetococcales bacterium]|nr:hypothetical protein [Magnetococcales bacterium]